MRRVLEAKVALVTGAGSGIGEATARLFAAEGAAVICADIDLVAAKATASSIASGRGQSRAQHVDISDDDSVRDLMHSIREHEGVLDIVFNNAGVEMRRPRQLADLDVEEWERQLRINLSGVFHCCRHAVPLLAERPGSSIVNNASLAATKARPGLSAYSAAKAGVIALTRVLALEVAPAIRVNSISPLATETPMLDRLSGGASASWAQRVSMSTEVPLGRLNKVGDIAEAVLFLVSERASMITGIDLVIDGGARL